MHRNKSKEMKNSRRKRKKRGRLIVLRISSSPMRDKLKSIKRRPKRKSNKQEMTKKT